MSGGKKNSADAKLKLSEKDIEQVTQLYQFMCDEGLSDLSIEDAESKIIIKRRRKNQNTHHNAQSTKTVVKTNEEQAKENRKNANNNASYITSPLIGTFYRSPSPTSEPFVRANEKVEAGRILCIVEAMKVMNEIRADKPCQIKKILVENTKNVSAGQALFEVEWL